MSRAWIAVASAEHVRRGLAGGFMQVCHGKDGPLRRMRPGDRVANYSPTVTFGGKDRCQAFTACGIIRPGDPYAFDMGGGFIPFRRDVDWRTDTQDAAILPLLDRLEFTAGRRNWGYAFRFGVLTVSEADMDCIEAAMTAAIADPV